MTDHNELKDVWIISVLPNGSSRVTSQSGVLSALEEHATTKITDLLLAEAIAANRLEGR